MKIRRDQRSHGMKATWFAAASALALAAGCGYSFSGSSLPSYIGTIAIPVFENKSLDATIADEVTTGISDRFMSDNRLKIAREAHADCILEGKVSMYDRRVYSYTPGQEPEEYIVVIVIAVVLKDRVKNKDLWSNERLQTTATYSASQEAEGEKTGLPASEQEAREAAIKLLAEDILAKTLEQW